MKTAIVTGGNRGIGLEICKQLDRNGFRVILCSRNLEAGLRASQSFSENVIVKQLDVTNEDSIKRLFEFVKSEYGVLDVLINNAGLGENSQQSKRKNTIKKIAKKNFYGFYVLAKEIRSLMNITGMKSINLGASDIPLEDVRQIMETNLYGAWRMIQVFLPLLAKSEDGRIINVSSGMGELLSLTGLYPGYSLSKTLLNALTIMFSNELDKQGIKVNAMCPGWVRTDMGGPDALRSIEEGADTAVWLAMEDNIETGKFFRDRQIINW